MYGKINEEKRMKAKLSLLLICLLLFSVQNTIKPVEADALYSEVEFIPQIISTTNLSRVTLGVYVTPQNGQTIDAVQTNLVTFSADKLKFVGTGVTWGNLFSSGLFKIDGTVDNNAGTITNIVWGSTNPTGNPGYLYYMTFDVIGSGNAYVDIDYDALGIARNGMPLSKRVNNNCTFYIMEIPTTPTISAFVNGSKRINFDWERGISADKTRIEYSTVSGTWDVGEGTLVYFDTGNYFNHINLTPLTTYYYRIWSWNETPHRRPDQAVGAGGGADGG